jgi:gliding motility-associated-like protein
MTRCLPPLMLAWTLLAGLPAWAQLHWVPNEGQWDVPARMRADWAGGVTWLEPDGMRLWVAGEGYQEVWAHAAEGWAAPPPDEGKVLESHAWRVHWEGASTAAPVETLREAGHRVNIYKGSDPSRWAEGLVPKERYKLRNLWPGIDLRVGPRTPGDREARPGPGWKEDWLVAPGASVADIAIRHEGVALRLAADGTLHVQLGTTAEAEMAPPFAYQQIDGRLVEVDVRYRVEGLRVGFDVGAYDPNHPLVIDPDIVFATYIGAVQPNWGFTAAYDDEARALGGTALWDGALGTYPTTAGAIQTQMTATTGPFDCGFAVFSADGTDLIYSTVFGGDELDVPSSIVADSEGAIYVMGTTGSSNFPVTSGAYDMSFCPSASVNLDACCFYPGGGGLPNGSNLFVLKFTEVDAGCTLDASTYVGGCNGPSGVNRGDYLAYNYGDVFRGEINVDAQDRPWVASVTGATDFPVVNAPYPAYGGGVTDAVLFRMSADLTALEWSTFLGGSAEEAAYGVQFTPAGDAVVCGGTSSANFPTHPSGDDTSFGGLSDGFVVKFPAGGGAPTGATFFGTNNYDQTYFVQVDPLSQVYVFGQSIGGKPITAGTYSASPNAGQFVACLTPALDDIVWHTRVGDPGNTGSVDISPTAFLVSDCGEIYMSGWGGATNNSQSPYIFSSGTNGMPTTPDGFQLGTNDGDFWLGVMDPGGTDLNYATYFGGGTSNEHVDGGTSRFDKDGTVYQAMCAGCGGNSDLPTTAGAWSSTNDSFNCNLGLFKFELGELNVGIDVQDPDQLCDGQTVTFVNTSTSGYNYLWTFDDNTTSTEYEPEHVFPNPGTFTVILTVTDPAGCLAPVNTEIEVNIQTPPAPNILPVDPVCAGEQVELIANGTPNLVWTFNPALGDLTDAVQVVTPPVGTSTFTVTDSNGCGEGEASIEVVVQQVVAEITPSTTAICLGESVNLIATGAADAAWSPPTGLSTTSATTVSASPSETTTYTVQLTDDIGCTGEATATVSVVPGPPGDQVYPTAQICLGESVQLPGAEGDQWLWSPGETLNDNDIQFPYAFPDETTTYYVSIANICGTGVDEVTVEVRVPEAYASEDGGVCRGTTFGVSASGNDPVSTFLWTPSELVTAPSAATTTVFPNFTQTFTVYVTDSEGCTASDEVVVYVTQPPEISAGPDLEVPWLTEVTVYGSTTGQGWYWTPSDAFDCDTCLEANFTPVEPGWYTLHAADSTGCGGSDSMYVDIFYPVYVPNTFTPNNDGINDVFQVEGENLRGFWMAVYNRWGERVFYSDDPATPWLGNVAGGDHFAPDGMYLWQVRVELAGGPLLLEGHVHLLR